MILARGRTREDLDACLDAYAAAPACFFIRWALGLASNSPGLDAYAGGPPGCTPTAAQLHTRCRVTTYSRARNWRRYSDLSVWFVNKAQGWIRFIED